MGTRYEQDVVAWASEQAALLRAGKLHSLDLANLAEEIEDVGRSERNELGRRLSRLIAYLLEWQYQPERRGNSWLRTIREQRRAIAAHIAQAPSLKATLRDETWLAGVWADALARALEETGLDTFPKSRPWSTEQVLAEDFHPVTPV